MILTQIFSGVTDQKNETPIVVFTEKEIAYLKEKKEITVCGKKDWLPYMTFRGEKPKGILPELMAEYEKIIGIPIKYIKTSNWGECIEKTKTGDIDMVDAIMNNPNTFPGLISSKTYHADFLILVSKVKKSYIRSIEDTGYKSVAIVGSFKNLVYYIKKKYPNMHLTYVDNIKDGLEKVLKGQVNFYLDIFVPTAFRINKQ